LSEEAIEILTAYPLTLAKGENMAIPQSGLGVFRAFLRLVSEFGRAIPYVDISRQIETSETVDAALPTRDRLQWVHFPGRQQESQGGPSAGMAAEFSGSPGSCVIDLLIDLEAAFPAPEIEHVGFQESPQSPAGSRVARSTDGPASYEGLTRAEKEEVELMGNRALRKRKQVPPLLLRTSYEPSGSLFTAGTTRGLLDFLASRARVSLRALDALLLAPRGLLDIGALFRSSVDDVHAVMPVDPLFASCGNPDWRAYELAQEPRSRGIRVQPLPYTDPSLSEAAGILAVSSAQFLGDRPPVGYDPLRLILPIVGRTATVSGSLRFDRYAPEAVGISLGAGSSSAVEPELSRLQDTAIGRKKGAVVRDPSALLASVLAESGALFRGGGLAEEVEEGRQAALLSASAVPVSDLTVDRAPAAEEIGAAPDAASPSGGARDGALSSGPGKPKRRRWRDSTGKWQKAPSSVGGAGSADREAQAQRDEGPKRAPPPEPVESHHPRHSGHSSHSSHPHHSHHARRKV